MSKSKRPDDLSFEKALERLEQIVEALEEGNLSLEDAIAKFEEGTKLRKICEEKLTAAERKIEILLKDDNGELTTQPTNPQADEGEATE